MITQMEKRKYTLKQRAAQRQGTRERIVDAAMRLHEEIGPAGTTVTAIADLAGVQRLTVYRHFADERALFEACSSKWFGLHGPPDVSEIQSEDMEGRTRAMLCALFRYYRETERMWTAVYRDAEKSPAVAETLVPFERYLAQIRKELMAGRESRGSKRVAATLAHVLRFSTWRSLAAQRLGDAAMADLACAWLRAAAGSIPTSAARSTGRRR